MNLTSAISPAKRVAVFEADALELAQVPSDADVGEVGVGPFGRLDLALAGLAARQGLEEGVADLGHQLLGIRHGRGDGLLAHDLASDQVVRDLVDRVTLSPLGLLLLGAVAECAAGEGPVLVEVAIDVRLDDGGTFPRPHVGEGLLHRQVDGQRVHAIDLPTRHAEARSASGQPGLGGDLAHVRRHGVLVVLDEEADRQVPGAGQVEGLERRADVRGPVPEVGDRHVVGPGVTVRPCRAGRERHAAADDGVRADRAGLEPLQVHRAAPTVGEPPVQPADLGQCPQQRGPDLVGDGLRRVDPLGREVRQDLGEELVVSSMGAVDRVATGQSDHRSDRAPLLADAGVRGTVDEPGGSQVQDVLLEASDQHQLAQHRREQCGICRVPVRVGGLHLDPGSGRCKGLVLGHGGLIHSGTAGVWHQMDPFSRRSCDSWSLSSLSYPTYGSIMEDAWLPDFLA